MFLPARSNKLTKSGSILKIIKRKYSLKRTLEDEKICTEIDFLLAELFGIERVILKTCRIYLPI